MEPPGFIYLSMSMYVEIRTNQNYNLYFPHSQKSTMETGRQSPRLTQLLLENNIDHNTEPLSTKMKYSSI